MTAKKLIAAWDERDRRYSVRHLHGQPQPLTPIEQEAILGPFGRVVEINQLPLPERAVAFAALARWRAPEVTE
jgi:hypothetical protein